MVAAAGAADVDARARELERVRQQIRAVQAELQRERGRQDRLSAELRTLDQNIGQIMGRLRQLEQEQAEKQRRVEALREEYAGEEARLRQQQDYLGRQLLSAYAQGQQAFLKLLLNQEDPAAMGRMMAYYRHFNDARAERIRAAAAQLERFKEVERLLREELIALEELRGRQLAERQQLAEARSERSQALARLQAEIEEKNLQLARLQGDEKQLQKVLDELRNALADIQQDPRLKQRPFKDSRGRLDWPLQGTLAARFGQERGLGSMRWSGLVIEGKAGAAVRAVSHGQVVFADWLRGMGLLLIIDHGDGYMTLYGHNEAIYKEAGDWVQAGEVIAAVGTSGGRNKPGLYFEIRSGGKPVDPLTWLRPRGGGA